MNRMVGMILLGTVACSAPAARPPTAREPVRTGFSVPASQSGTLLLARGLLQFAPCGTTGDGNIVTDRSDGEGAALMRDLAPGGGRVTALVRVEHDSLIEVRYAGPEGPTCTTLPPAGDLNAVGEEPFWHLRIAGDSARLRTPEDTAGTSWHGGTWQSEANDWHFVAAGVGGDTVRVVLRAERCTDGMSGARYPFHATVNGNGVVLQGCGLEGQGAMRAAP
ncbi:MAG: hypothetical protein ABJC19_08495 [Gemmatimonadota bacterium]